jgi:hypothetical protein
MRLRVVYSEDDSNVPSFSAFVQKEESDAQSIPAFRYHTNK